MNTVYSYIPYLFVVLFLIGSLMMLMKEHERLTKKQLQRIERLFGSIEVDNEKDQFPLFSLYKNWLNSHLARIGYIDRIKEFYSLMRAIFLFCFFVSFGLCYLSGFELLISFRIAFVIGILSLSIPHLIIWYMLSKRQGLIAKEFVTVANYIYEAIDGKKKDLFNSIKESIGLVTYLEDPLERFLVRYNTVGLAKACDEFLLEVPIPEAEQFITLISNGFEYRDKENMMSFIRTLREAKYSLALSFRKRKESMNQKIYSVLIIIPGVLTISIILYCSWTQAQKVLAQTTF